MTRPALSRHSLVTKYAANAAILIIVASLVQAVNLLRTLELSSHYGASASLDAFYLANNVTILLFNIIGAGVTTVLVPQLIVGISARALREFTRLLTILSLVLSVLIAGLVVASVFLPLAAVHHGNERLIVVLTLLLLTGQQFRIGTAVSTSLLQSVEVFLPSRFAAVLPAALPVTVFLVVPSLTVFCAATLASYALEWVVNFAYSRPHRPRDFPDSSQDQPVLSRLRHEAAPVIGSSALFQVQILAMTLVVGHFGAGTISIYGNASQLASLAQMLLVQNLLILIYPRLSRWVQHSTRDACVRVPPLVNLTNAPILLMIVVYTVAGHPILLALFDRGRFDASAVDLMYEFGLLLLIALPLSTARDVLYRVLYAEGLARLAATNSLWVVAFNAGTLVVLLPTLGVYSIFVSLLLGSIFSLVRVAITMRHHGLPVPLNPLATGLLVYSLLGLVAMGVGIVMPVSSPQHLAGTLLRALVSTICFCLLAAPAMHRDVARLRRVRV